MSEHYRRFIPHKCQGSQCKSSRVQTQRFKKLLSASLVFQEGVQACPNPFLLPSHKEPSYHTLHCPLCIWLYLIQNSSINYLGRTTQKRWSPAPLLRKEIVLQFYIKDLSLHYKICARQIYMFLGVFLAASANRPLNPKV